MIFNLLTRLLGLAPPTPAGRSRRQRPLAPEATLLCQRPGCSARANPENGVLVCDPHMELLLCLRDDAAREIEDDR